ncbi:hypothetical protein HPP92_003741 [Vanilla planifolia]|uniref:Uncharacterized protein n=1 Tax=Vanilla planifolia TaxID=51239 RepID=A0A835S8N2_VANPL|nr:hypothetical protein HPP92_003741 [Vanilla planifolia]
MRILSWVRSKISKTQNKRFNEDRSCSAFYASKQNACKEEFKDRTQTFLSIGMSGKDEQRELDAAAQMPQMLECPVLAKEAAELSIEEVIKLQMEIAKLLKLKPSSFSDGSDGGSLVKDLLSDNHKFVRKRSVSLLVKEMFAQLQPSLRKPVTEPKMEKIYRKILHNKIHPQAAHRVSTTKMCLSKNPEEEDEREGEEEEEEEEKEEEEEEEEEREDGSKWVRTDAEFIVLEI